MNRPNPHYRNQDQYSTYYRNEQVAHYVEDFAPRQRSYPMAQPRGMREDRASAAYPPRRLGVRRPRRQRGVLLAGGGMLALAALVVGPKPLFDNAEQSANQKAVCQETVQTQSVLSRAELSELLAVAERAPKEDVRAIIDEPYCTLPSVEVREGAIADREAYPLEFNPQTWFIVLYEEGEYAGFDFSFYRE